LRRPKQNTTATNIVFYTIAMGKADRAGVASRVYVWDTFVRVFHWTLVVSFTVAYLTEDNPLTVHVWARYVVGALVVARIVWGFVGSPRARFSTSSTSLPPRFAMCVIWFSFVVASAISAIAPAVDTW
jgi:cytochrome b